MAKTDFEKRRKSVEKLFNVIFWIQLVAVVAAIILKILYLTDSISEDLFTYVQIIVNIGVVIVLFIATRLAKSGNKAAGIIGIITGIVLFVAEGLMGNILGILLLIDSILFLVNFNKK